MPSKTVRYSYLAIGWISFALGLIGVFLPVMPTAPFLIVTAYCFSKGSERLHEWLVNLPKVGEPIREWESFGIIRKRAKITATIMIIVSFSGSIIFVPMDDSYEVYVKVTMAIIGISALIFILTRPSEAPPPSNPV